jgi:small subunit ribosomal protein S15
MALSVDEKQKIMGEHAQKQGDTGSPEIQVALLTEKILKLTDHLKLHRGDNNSRRGLLKMVSKRRRLLNYLMKMNDERYRGLINTLGLSK